MVADAQVRPVTRLHVGHRVEGVGQVGQGVVDQVAGEQDQVGIEPAGFLHDALHGLAAGEGADVQVGHQGDPQPVQLRRQAGERHVHRSDAELAQLRSGVGHPCAGEQRRRGSRQHAEELSAGRRFPGADGRDGGRGRQRDGPAPAEAPWRLPGQAPRRSPHPRTECRWSPRGPRQPAGGASARGRPRHSGAGVDGRGRTPRERRPPRVQRTRAICPPMNRPMSRRQPRAWRNGRARRSARHHQSKSAARIVVRTIKNRLSMDWGPGCWPGRRTSPAYFITGHPAELRGSLIFPHCRARGE